MDGLDIDLKEFKQMKSLQRDILIYKNLKHIRTNLTCELEKKLKDYSFHKKIQYVWLICLTAFLGIKKWLGF